MKSKINLNYSSLIKWIFCVAFIMGCVTTKVVAQLTPADPPARNILPLVDGKKYITRGSFLALPEADQSFVLDNMPDSYVVLDLVNYTNQDPGDPDLIFMTIDEFYAADHNIRLAAFLLPDKYIIKPN